MKACKQCGNDVEIKFRAISRLAIEETFGGPNDGAKAFKMTHNDGRVDYSVPINDTGLEDTSIPRDGTAISYGELTDENGDVSYLCNACCEELGYPFCPFI